MQTKQQKISSDFHIRLFLSFEVETTHAHLYHFKH